MKYQHVWLGKSQLILVLITKFAKIVKCSPLSNCALSATRRDSRSRCRRITTFGSFIAQVIGDNSPRDLTSTYLLCRLWPGDPTTWRPGNMTDWQPGNGEAIGTRAKTKAKSRWRNARAPASAPLSVLWLLQNFKEQHARRQWEAKRRWRKRKQKEGHAEWKQLMNSATKRLQFKALAI